MISSWRHLRHRKNTGGTNCLWVVEKYNQIDLHNTFLLMKTKNGNNMKIKKKQFQSVNVAKY
jgi:hypothetical protein